MCEAVSYAEANSIVETGLARVSVCDLEASVQNIIGCVNDRFHALGECCFEGHR